jgi:ABC-2 type transport system permease protein
MNGRADAMAETPGTQGTAPPALAATRPLYWSVRRELWESRSIYVAPLAVAGLFLVGFLLSLIRLPGQLRAAAAVDPPRPPDVLVQPYDFAALAIMGTTFIVGVLYCLDALSGERRDRSILFWKSMPVSDRTTVLAKASVAILVLPLVTFVTTVVTQSLMLLAGTLVLLGSGLSVTPLWAQVSPLGRSLALLYHLLGVHGLWYAPIFAWLLMVSAWARRTPFLWAFLPPLAIGMVEKLAFDTSHFAALLGHRVSGGAEAVASSERSVLDPMTQMALGAFVTSPGLWIGLAVAAAFLAVAVRLRRSRA